jgi:protein NRD1
MAHNVIDELDTQLASLNTLKAPGASKTKITAITQLCVSNIQVSMTPSTTHFHPTTHM